jgi:hypothetical protein
MNNMKLTGALSALKREAAFLGMDLKDLIVDVRLRGHMMYSKKVIMSVDIVLLELEKIKSL